MTDPFVVTRQPAGNGQAWLTVAGELDLATCPEVKAEIDRSIDGAGTSLLVLDLSRLSFIDSTGIRTFIYADRRMREAGGRFVLLSPAPIVGKVLEVSGAHQLLEIAQDPEDI